MDDRDGYVFVAGSGGLTVLDSHPGRAVRITNRFGASDPDGIARTFAFDPSMQRLFVVNDAIPNTDDNPASPHYHDPSDPNGTVVMIDVRTGQEIDAANVGVGPIAVAVNSRTGRVFVLTLNPSSLDFSQDNQPPDLQQNGSVTVLDARNGDSLATTQVGLVPDALAVDEATGRVFVANRDSHSVSLLDGRTGHLLRTIPLDLTPYAVAVDAPTGRVFVAGGEDSPSGQSVRILDANSGKVVQSIAAGHGAQALAIDPTSSHVLVATDNGVAVVDGRSGAVLRSVAVRGEPVAIAIDSRTGHAFVADYLDDSVTVLNASGMLLRTLRVGSRPRLLAVDANSRRVFVSNSDEPSVSVFSADVGGKPSAPPMPPSPVLRQIDWQPPAQFLLDARHKHVYIVRSRPPTITMLDASSGQTLPTPLSRLAIAFPSVIGIDALAGRLIFLTNTASRTVIMTSADLQTGKVVRATRLTTPGPSSATLIVDEPGNRVFVTSSGAGSPFKVRLDAFDAMSGAPLWTTMIGASPQVSVDDQADRVFIAEVSYPYQHATIRVLSAHTGAVVHVIPMKDSVPAQLIVDAPANRAFVVADEDVLILDAHDGAILHRIHDSTTASTLTFTLDLPTNHLFISERMGQGSLWMLDAVSGAVLRTSHNGGALPLDDARAHTVIFWGGDGDNVGNRFYGSVVDARTGKALPGFRVPGALSGVDQDSGHLWASDLGPGEGLLPSTTTRFLTLDGRTGAVQRILTLGHSPSLLVVDDGARRAFLADPPNGVLLMLDETRL